MGLLADDVSSTAPFWAGTVLVVALSLPLLVLWAPLMQREARAGRGLAEPAGVASGD